MNMLDRLTQPQKYKQSKPFDYLKSLVAGYFASNLYSQGRLFSESDQTQLTTEFKPQKFAENRSFIFNKSAYHMRGGAVRFAFYDIFKRLFYVGFGEKWSQKFRYLTYGVSAMAAEFLAVTVSFPFDNIKILERRAVSIEQIDRIVSVSNQAQIKEIFPDDTINTEKGFRKQYKRALYRNLPCTTVTFTTFQFASQIWYDYIVQAPKQNYNGFTQSAFSFINGSIAGLAFYFATRVFDNLDPSIIITVPKEAMRFYIFTTGVQFAAFNFLKILLDGNTFGKGTNSLKY